MSAAQEWRNFWPLVMAGMAGLTLGTIPSATLGVFMDPLGNEFGWSRTEISLGLTIFAIISLPLTPFAGVLVDRFGPRRVAIPGVALSAAAFASFGLLSGSLVQWLAIWVAYTLASLLTRTLVWNKAVSAAFTTSRGLAIAVLLCGTAVSSSLSPAATNWMIEHWGWRTAYLGLGAGWGSMVLLLVVLFFREKAAPAASGTGAAAVAPMLPGGMTVREAVRSLTMHRIAIAMFLQSTMGVSIMVHLVPMLTADGLTRGEAAGIAAILGMGSIAGKLITGWLADRVTGSLLPVACFGGPAVAYVILLQAQGSVLLLSGAVIVLGYCSGASLHLTTYLTTRYAGLRNFATIFGLISSLMALSAGIGPVLAGVIFDATGSYALLLTAGIGVALVAGAAVFGLGPYPVFPPFEAGAGDTGKKAVSTA
jgi:MFS family permease